MTRNWGLPKKTDAFRQASSARPVATLSITAVFGIIGAAAAVISFAEARDMVERLFHGRSLIMAVIAAGFGCWVYVLLARARFAAHFTGGGGAFSDLLRFYARATIALAGLVLAGFLAKIVGVTQASILILCVAGGAGAAAAFQTVLAFVPGSEPEKPV